RSAFLRRLHGGDLYREGPRRTRWSGSVAPCAAAGGGRECVDRRPGDDPPGACSRRATVACRLGPCCSQRETADAGRCKLGGTTAPDGVARAVPPLCGGD